jgi:DivIVA domain-containing protein
MAMSFARPDPSSPASIADAAFGTGRRGFDQGEVRDFLRMVAAELGRLQERERFLERELRTAQSNPDLASVQLDELALTRLLGEETARVLTTARESAAEIRQKAEQSAAQLLSEASDEAARMREEAEIEASRRRSDAASDAEAELSMAKQQGREMVNEARAYRERVLSELARRRELAREQIEQLLHGRDRLMQSFEHARLVAVEVVAELQPLGEPDEYVNLSPTTGPVPVMVPNTPRPVETSVETAQPVEEVLAEETLVEETLVEELPSEDGPAEPEPSEILAGDDSTVEETPIEETPIEEPSVAARDDVVVDLFARLRADATLTDADADSEVDADGEVDADQQGCVDSSGDVPGDDDVAEATPFDQRDADLTPLIVASAKKLKRVLADEQNEVLDRLRQRDAVRTLSDLLPPSAEHLGRYRGAIVDDLLAAAGAGASLVTPERVATIAKADVNKAVGAGESVLDEWLIVPLRERLERCVIDGNGDNTAITKRIRAVYREWKTQHIDEQLDDVIRASYGHGAFTALEPGAAVVWTVDPSQVACADCDDNTLGGAVAVGDAFPTGHRFPPAHPGCRCLLLPADR